MFLQNLLFALKQIFILYLLVLVGFICDRKGIFTEKTAKLTNELMFTIILPAIILQSFLTADNSKENIGKMLIAAAFGTLLQVLGVLFGTVFFHKKDDPNNGIFKYGCAFGNTGYMAIPLAEALCGKEGVLFSSVVLMVFNIFNFTYGIYAIAGGKASLKVKQIFINPGTLMILIGLPILLSGVKMPEIILKPVDYVASVNTPLAMIIFGTYLSKANIKTMFTDKRIYLAAAIKLILIPIAMLGGLKLFGQTGALALAVMISSSVPSANTTFMFSVKYGLDAGLASKLVAAVSFMSIVTMPLAIALTQYVCK